MAVASRLNWAWFHIRSSPTSLAAVSLAEAVLGVCANAHMTTRRQQATGFMIELPFPSRIPIFSNFEASSSANGSLLLSATSLKTLPSSFKAQKRPDCIVRLLPSKFCSRFTAPRTGRSSPPCPRRKHGSGRAIQIRLPASAAVRSGCRTARSAGVEKLLRIRKKDRP